MTRLSPTVAGVALLLAASCGAPESGKETAGTRVDNMIVEARPSSRPSPRNRRSRPSEDAATDALPSGRQLPADVARFLEQSRECLAHSMSELGRRGIERGRCLVLSDDQARLVRKYANDAEITAIIRESYV